MVEPKHTVRGGDTSREISCVPETAVWFTSRGCVSKHLLAVDGCVGRSVQARIRRRIAECRVDLGLARIMLKLNYDL